MFILISVVAVFCLLGYLSTQQQVPLSNLFYVRSGQEFTYITLASALALLSNDAQLWSVVFFALLFLLEFGSQVVRLDAVCSAIKDRFPEYFITGVKAARNGGLLAICLCLIGSAIDMSLVTQVLLTFEVLYVKKLIIFISQNGKFVFYFFDYYAAHPLVIWYLCSVYSVAIGWFFGE